MMEIFKGLAVFCLTLTALLAVVNAGISCKNDDNKEVDWFFIYKFPKEAKDSNKENKHKDNLFEGDEYVYVDSNTPPSAAYWTMSFRKISEQKSAIANTIAPLREKTKPTDLTYAVYNDEVHGTPAQSYGHTKGLFLFDKKKGVWLIHSVPSFPELEKSPFFQEKGKKKSQIFLCVTFPSTELEKIAKHLRLQRPNVYAHDTALHWNEESDARRLLKKDFITEAPWNLTADLTDVAGNTYTSFATHSKFHEDVYSCLVAPTLRCSLLVSSWQNGAGGRVPNHCNGTFTVANVNVGMNFKLGVGVSKPVKNTVDHGKLAISNSKDNPYVCVGTLNRMFSQQRRGGETLCFKNKVLHGLLLTTVDSVKEEDSGERKKKKERKETKEKMENKKKVKKVGKKPGRRG